MISLLTRRKLLSEQQEVLLEREKTLLLALRDALHKFGADVAPGDLKTLDETIARLGELFLLVIAGEFNAGKSSFINALLGERVLAEGVTPTTDRITLLRYAEQPAQKTLEEFLLEVTFPADVLQRITIVDTPGTNAIIRRHEELTRDFVPRADLVLFVTSADRPFTESERAFLSTIQEWGKKIIIVLNKVDLLEPAELDQVMTFINDNARNLLGITPQILPVSARLAKRARLDGGGEEAWKSSRFEAIEHLIFETLDEEERLRLKLLSPLGVAKKLGDKYLSVVEGRLDTLQTDVATLENIERQLELFRDDLTNDFRFHLTEVDNILNEFELRGNQFFDDNLRLSNILELRDTERIKQMFTEQVVMDVPQQIEGRLHALIDWMIEKNLRVWQSIMDYLTRNRVPERRDHLIGDVGGSFDYNRGQLLESVVYSAQRVVETYDREKESQALVEDVRGALAATALTEAGAVGIGALLIALLHGAAFDITGVLAAGVVAAFGLYMLPARRRQVKKEFHAKIATMRTQLRETMEREFNSEMEQMLARIRGAIAPYTRFIRAEREHLTGVQQKLSDADVDMGRLRAEIDAIKKEN